MLECRGRAGRDPPLRRIRSRSAEVYLLGLQRGGGFGLFSGIKPLTQKWFVIIGGARVRLACKKLAGVPSIGFEEEMQKMTDVVTGTESMVRAVVFSIGSPGQTTFA